MRSTFSRKRLLFLMLILFAVTGFVYLWDFKWGLDRPLCAGLITAVATVFGIHRLLAYREGLKWRQAKSSVLNELAICLNGILTNIRGLAQIDWPTLLVPSVEGMSEHEWAKQTSEVMTRYFEDISGPLRRDIADNIRQRDKGAWDSFLSATQSCLDQLDKIMATFPSVTSQPELIEKIIDVRKSAGSPFVIRTIFFDVLGVSPEEQPVPKGLYKEAVSKDIHDRAVRSIDELIISVVSAKKVVDRMMYISA